MLRTTFTALALAAAGALHAQTPPPDAAKGKRTYDCSQAADPKACEERRQKMRAAHEKAKVACEGKQGPERGECMRVQMCAQAQNPAQCEARAKEQAERRRQAMQACQGKQGDEMKACMQAQRGKPPAKQ
jgi:hypothetical protein